MGKVQRATSTASCDNTRVYFWHFIEHHGCGITASITGSPKVDVDAGRLHTKPNFSWPFRRAPGRAAGSHREQQGRGEKSYLLQEQGRRPSAQRGGDGKGMRRRQLKFRTPWRIPLGLEGGRPGKTQKPTAAITGVEKGRASSATMGDGWGGHGMAGDGVGMERAGARREPGRGASVLCC